jgi:hypothetical protein
MSEVQNVFNLNDCMLFKTCYNRTEASMAIKRSVRPFIKAINKAMKEEAIPKYNAKAEELLAGRKPEELSKEELKKFQDDYSSAMYQINAEIYPNIILDRNSTWNFFARFWSDFSFSAEKDGDFMMQEADSTDTKVVERYPDLNVDLDSEAAVGTKNDNDSVNLDGEDTPQKEGEAS